MRGGVGVQSNNPRGFMLFRRMGKEPLGGSHIMPFAQEKINRSTLLIDRAVRRVLIESSAARPDSILLEQGV